MNKKAQIDWTQLKPQPVIGVDEVGRGCLAGPVFSSAVLFIPKSFSVPQKDGEQPVFKESKYPPQTKEEHYPDSKQISPEERKKLARIIQKRHIYGLGIGSVAEIEELNILQASLLSMKRAVVECYSKWQFVLKSASLNHSLVYKKTKQDKNFNKPWAITPFVHVLVDGNALIPHLPPYFHQTAFVQGDQRLSPIASASIIAKVKRDEWISRQDTTYPQYGFSRHKGYATKQHIQALNQYGPCPLHRKNFRLIYEQV